MLKKSLYLPLIAGLFIFADHDKIPPTDALTALVNKFYNYTNRFPQQKIYIHTDKPYYLSGDNIYGKIYLVNENRASYDSIINKKIYVELINDENTVIKKTIVNGLYSSLTFNFHLSDSLREGNYILRAYTLWMISFRNKENIFYNFIHISNKANHLISSISYKDSALSSVNIRLQDTLKHSYANMPVYYQLLYKNKPVKQANASTNSDGTFYVDLNAVSGEDRHEVAIKIKTNMYEKRFTLPVLNNDLDVQFLPEGGNLISGIGNNVAFKAIDSYGHGTAVRGYIKNSQGIIVARFKSTHLGMGEFQFIPENGVSYTAYLQSKSNKEFNFPIVPADDYAYQLTVLKQAMDKISVRVALGDSLYKKNKITYLVATSHGRVCFTSRGIDLYETDIPLNNFPEGIAQLTLFNSEMQQVSERLIYVSHPDLNTTITANKANYGQRENIMLKLKTTDVNGKLLKGMYSVSVTDDHVVKPDDNSGNIKTYLLLSPYLKGYIEEPGYYFKNDDTSTKENLDLVMLTHGWSRYNWSDADSAFKVNPASKDSSLYITGTINNKKNIPAVGYNVLLLSATDNTFLGTATTDKLGKFSFRNIDYTDSTSFLIQVKNTKGVNEDVDINIDETSFPLIDIDRSFVPAEVTTMAQSGINFYINNMYDSLQDKENVRVLKEVVINTRKKVTYDESKRVSPMSYIIPPEFIEKYGNISLTDLLYSVPGATIFDGHISFFGRNSITAYSDPLIILDGVEFEGGLGINAHDVEFIEVLRGGEAAIYGMRGSNGVVLINTKTGKDAIFKQKGIKSFNTPSYHIAKQFYSPKYETDESKLAKPKDERTTLYWNGNVTSDSKNQATISFFAADEPTTYTVTVEGIAENGEFIHKTFPVNRTKQ